MQRTASQRSAEGRSALHPSLPIMMNLCRPLAASTRAGHVWKRKLPWMALWFWRSSLIPNLGLVILNVGAFPT